MGSLVVDKAGVGSAVNDTTRELGGTLGVAVVGSVFTSVYVGALATGPVFGALRRPPSHSPGTPSPRWGRSPHQLGPNARAFVTEVSDAFLAGLAVACVVVAGVAFAGSLFALRFLPARAAAPEMIGDAGVGGELERTDPRLLGPVGVAGRDGEFGEGDPVGLVALGGRPVELGQDGPSDVGAASVEMGRRPGDGAAE